MPLRNPGYAYFGMPKSVRGDGRQARIELLEIASGELAEEAHERPTVAGDLNFGSLGGLLHVMAEVVAELMGADVKDVLFGVGG